MLSWFHRLRILHPVDHHHWKVCKSNVDVIIVLRKIILPPFLLLGVVQESSSPSLSPSLHLALTSRSSEAERWLPLSTWFGHVCCEIKKRQSDGCPFNLQSAYLSGIRLRQYWSRTTSTFQCHFHIKIIGIEIKLQPSMWSSLTLHSAHDLRPDVTHSRVKKCRNVHLI